MSPIRSSCARALLLAALGVGLATCSASSAPELSAPVQQGAPEPSAAVTAEPEIVAKASVSPAQQVAPNPRRIALEGVSLVEQVAFLGEDRLLVDQRDQGSYGLVSVLWDVGTLAPVAWGERAFTGVAWAVSPDRKTVVYSVSDDDDFEHGHLAVVDAASGATISKLTLARSVDAQPLAISADGARLATSTAQPGEPAVVTVWSMPSGKRVRAFRLLRDTGYDSGYWVDVALTSDGSKLVALALDDVRVGDEAIDIWDVKTGKRKRLDHGSIVEDENGDMRSSDTSLGRTVAISPDDALVATGMVDHAVRLWDMDTGKEVRRLVHDSLVTAVAFSPDGTKIASACAGAHVELWEVQSGRLLATQPLEGRHARSLAFSPDGTTIAAAETETVLLWSVADVASPAP